MKIYFKGLDTLRAIGALVVVIRHIELFKINYGIPYFNTPEGHIALILFFVLSGFLITYLLIKEKEEKVVFY